MKKWKNKVKEKKEQRWCITKMRVKKRKVWNNGEVGGGEINGKRIKEYERKKNKGKRKDSE